LKALVLGSGGREHAIAWSIKKSTLVDKLYWTPGNAGTEEIAENPAIQVDDFPALLKFTKEEKIDTVIVGPEVPLVEGITDFFTENGVSIFGPTSEGARLEGSKIYAKRLMKQRDIPTADFKEFYEPAPALEYIRTISPPYVIKADGLAAGKGVVIARSDEEARKTLHSMFEKKIFGSSGTRVVIEDFLEGEEATLLALCDGKSVLPLISSQDHKPAYDGDRGPNTGGMGAIAPAPVVSERVLERSMDRILFPLLKELNKRNIQYRGILYAGLMIVKEEPFVVEFNCRLGDPEAEAVLPLLDSDFYELVLATVNGTLDQCSISWREGFCCDVVLASGGYPGRYEKEKRIRGVDQFQGSGDSFLFHAGTKKVGDSIMTDGGRVLNVAGTGKTLQQAINRAYLSVQNIHFDGMFCRKDIGFRGLKYFS
jgi:phosphoribosylamine--glycine ligase